MLAEPAGGASLSEVIRPASARLHVAPAGIVLSALEQKLAADRSDGRTTRLAAALASVADRYDYALIDCPPNVGILTFNALRAAREVVVPLETSVFAIHGVHKLLETLALLADRIGHQLAVRILPTLYDGRTRYARETLGEIRALFGELCFDTVIRSNVKLREAARAGRPVIRFARGANGALDYAALAVELAATPPEALAAPVPRTGRSARSSSSSATRGGRGAHRRGLQRLDPRPRGRLASAGGGPRAGLDQGAAPAPGTYQYRYVVDGEWREDPDNPRFVAGPIGGRNSLLVVR